MQEEYKEARKIGQKQYKKALSAGKIPYPVALDDILKDKKTAGEKEIGTLEIPVDLIVGTKGEGRQSAFSPDFFPLLDGTSEFALKWMNLYQYQLDEGLRDAIKVYEYKARFYVEEGNKRVSVSKYLKTPFILARVIRILPVRDDSEESKRYYEFDRFYSLTGTYQILFSKYGSYEKLLKLLGKTWEDSWSDEELQRLTVVYYQIASTFKTIKKDATPEETGDAFLKILEIYPYEEIKDKTAAELSDTMKTMKGEIPKDNSPEEPEVEHVMEPDTVKVPLVNKILPASKKPLKAAFVYDFPAEESTWAYAHEMGRVHVQEQFGDKILTTVYIKDAAGNDATGVIEQAVNDGNKVIFITTPKMMQATVKLAVNHPEVYFFNCSLNFPYKTVRTYYARLYETKFLLGLIAGAMSEQDVIAYEADYPIYGTVANINAFALGVQMVRPEAKVKLYWTCLKEEHTEEKIQTGAVISAKDSINKKGEPFGLYRQNYGSQTRYATTVINWGIFYERILELILRGTWKKSLSKEPKAINYWWGISAGVIELFCSDKMPHGTRRLVEKFRNLIEWGMFHPFEGIIYDQKGEAHGKENEHLSTEEIVTMTWLCENVIGSIPEKEKLTEKAETLVNVQGVVEEKA